MPRVLLCALLPGLLLASDQLDGLGMPLERRVETRIDSGASWRWWRMTSEADGYGSRERGRYEEREQAFLEAELALAWRPWRFELAAASNPPAVSTPSYRIVGSVLFIGDDPLWWELAPRLSLEHERRALELELAGGSEAVEYEQQRLELGFSGQGPELAGAEIELYLARSRYPAVLGFRGSDGSGISTLDRDFEHWRLGLGFRYDWAEAVWAQRRRYGGPYAAIWGELAWLWTEVGIEAESAARAATGRERIAEPLYWDLRGGIELGALWQRRARQAGQVELVAKLGWRLMGQVLASEDADVIVTDDDLLVLAWDQYLIEHGPFVQLGLGF